MTYTLAIVARRTHSAVSMSPSKASSAIHWMSSLRISLMLGKRVEAGNALGTTVVGKDLVKRTWRVGTFRGSGASPFEWRLYSKLRLAKA